MARNPKPPPPLEKEVQKTCVKLLKFLGWTVHRRNIGGMRWRKKDGSHGYVAFNEKSMSDLWGTMPDSRRFELEIKRYGKRPTRKQYDWLKANNGPHCCAFWVDNTEALERVAKALMNGMVIEWDLDDDDVYCVMPPYDLMRDQ